MGLEIKAYTEQMEPTVREFNRRLRSGGTTFQFPENHIPSWLPPADDREIYQEHYLAVEDDSIVRGGYILKRQQFMVNGQIQSIGNYQLPLSEGTIDRAYNMLGVRLLTDALRKQPVLYALGMGGLDRPLPQLLKSMGWTLVEVPFYFKVVRPFRFLRNMSYMRTSPVKRVLVDALAVSGVGWAGAKLLCRPKRRGALLESAVAVEVIERFESWADDLWNGTQSNFTFCAVRNAETLNILYPKAADRFIRLKIALNNEVIGWAVLLNTQMSTHKQFGNLRVGSIVDCLALPGRENQLIDSVSRHLGQRGVDLIVSNQSHRAYGAALRCCGFLKGPSNFAFAASKELTTLLEPFDQSAAQIHMNRGDGDGPIHL